MKSIVERIRILNESTVEECGMMPPMTPPKQQDNVDMNITIHGQGANGIRDLLHILKDLDQPAQPSHDHGHDPLMGAGHGIDVVVDDSYENEPEPAVADLAAVTPTGNDLASKGAEALKVNGGGNPMQESLVNRLASMYEEIKNK